PPGFLLPELEASLMQNQHATAARADLDLDLAIGDEGAAAAARVPPVTPPLPQTSQPAQRQYTGIDERTQSLPDERFRKRVWTATAEDGAPAVEDRPGGGDGPVGTLHVPHT